MTLRAKFLILGLLPIALLFSSATTVLADNVVVLGLMNDTAVVRIDGKLRRLRIGETAPEGLRLVAATSNSAVLEQDGLERHYAFGSSVAASYSAGEARPALTRTSATISSQNGLFRTHGRINGEQVKLIVDTGATWVSMSKGVATELGLDYRRSGTRKRVATALGETDAYVVKLDSVSVGDVELKDVEAAVIEGHASHDVLLGLSFLSRVNMQSSGHALLLQSRL